MIYRIFQIFIDSFKFLYREKISFYISSFTISICLALVSLILVISLGFIEKIKSIEIPELIVSYNKNLDDKCNDYCFYDKEQCPECAIYSPLKLDVLLVMIQITLSIMGVNKIQIVVFVLIENVIRQIIRLWSSVGFLKKQEQYIKRML